MLLDATGYSLHTRTRIHTNTHTHAHTHIYTGLYTQKHIHTQTHTHTCRYTNTHVRIRIHTATHMCIHIHAHIIWCTLLFNINKHTHDTGLVNRCLIICSINSICNNCVLKYTKLWFCFRATFVVTGEQDGFRSLKIV